MIKEYIIPPKCKHDKVKTTACSKKLALKVSCLNCNRHISTVPLPLEDSYDDLTNQYKEILKRDI